MTRRLDTALLGALSVLAVLPLWAGRFLPLYDYPAHLVIPAVLHQWSDPATRAQELYFTTGGLNPNSFHYAFTWLLGFVLPLEVASKVFLSLSLGALPWAMAFALRTFSRDARLAVLALPLCYGRGFWYGFVGYCAALPLSLVVLALVWRQLEQPSRRQAVLLGLAMVVLPFVHFFVMLATVGVAAVMTALSLRRPNARVVNVLALAAGPLVMVPWVVSRFTDASAPAATTSGPVFTYLPLADSVAMTRHWFLDGYISNLDEWLAAAMVVTLAALMGLGRLREPAPSPTMPFVIAGLFFAAYLALPFQLHRPFDWWAMNVRVLPLAYLWLVVATPAGALTRLGLAVLMPITLASIAWFGFIGFDFARFNREEAGLGEALAAIPKGAQVQSVFTDYRAPMHYSHFPHFYAGAYAVVHGAGSSVPFPPIPQGWVNLKVTPPTPIAGDSAAFDPNQHLAGSTHFLVHVCGEPGCLADPLVSLADVRRVVETARWRLYECVGGRCARR